MGQCASEKVGTAWVVRLQGWFISDQDAVLIEEALAEAPADAQCVVVNWSGILHISSTSLGAVMRCESDLAKLGRRYRNCAFSPRATQVVRPFRKSFPWNYFATEEEAVEACSATAAADSGSTTAE